MNNDLTFLASAYLDGDVTQAERAQVEGDAELLAEVERLRQVRAVLGDHDDAPISVRERHLAAALDAWDRLPAAERSGEQRDATPLGANSAAMAGAASVTAPASLSDRRQRRASSRVLAIAAGFILVLGGGLVLRSAIQSGGANDSFSIADAPAPAAEEQLDQQAQLEVAAADELFAEEGAATEEIFTEEPAAAPAEADSAVADDSESEGTGVVIGGPESAALEDELEVLDSEEALAIFADDIRNASRSEDIATETAEATEQATVDFGFDLCGLVDQVVGPALWANPGLFDESVLVGIARSTNEAVAYREADCTVVARTALLNP